LVKKMANEHKADKVVDREQQLQAKMMQFQILQGTYQTVQQQLQEAAARANELAATKVTLEGMGGTKPAPALLPIGSDNFVAGRLEKVDTVLVGIGGGIAVKRARTDAIKIIDGKLEELQKHVGQLSQQLAALEAELSRLQPQIEAMLQGR
jgi:prefoldin alpha subunit